MMNVLVATCGVVLLADATAFAAGRSCEDLASLTLPQTTISTAQPIAAGAFTSPGAGARGSAQNNAFKSLPAFCRVAATLAPTGDSDIKVEVWLPASGWNGKFLAVGNGGWAGSISYRRWRRRSPAAMPPAPPIRVTARLADSSRLAIRRS